MAQPLPLTVQRQHQARQQPVGEIISDGRQRRGRLGAARLRGRISQRDLSQDDRLPRLWANLRQRPALRIDDLAAGGHGAVQVYAPFWGTAHFPIPPGPPSRWEGG